MEKHPNIQKSDVNEKKTLYEIYTDYIE